MRIPYPDIDLEKVRALATERTARSSLRIVAKSIPVGHSTLHNFLGGVEPHPRVRTTLCEWYLRQGGPDAPVLAALELLTEPFQEGQREHLHDELTTAVRNAYMRAGRSLPAWLRKPIPEG